MRKRGRVFFSAATAGVQVATMIGLLWLAGCATAPRRPPARPTVIVPAAPAETSAVAIPPAAVPSAPGQPTTAAATPAAPGAAALPAGSFAIDVDSAPAGALIVVNERPVGRAPLRLVVTGTALGFFRDYTNVRARFIADSSQEQSSSVPVNFTPRDRIPATLIFTPQGAQRQWRE